MNVPELQLAIRGAPVLLAGSDAVPHSPRDVLEGLWSEVAPQLARLARAMGVAADRVDDVLQEVFVAAWEKSPTGVEREQLKWWLIRVTTNRCNLEHRKRKGWRAVLEKVGRLREFITGSASQAIQTGPVSVAAAAEERELVRRAVAGLAPEQRTVLVLRYFEHYDARQIGEILEMPHGTVRSHLHKARRALARALIEAGYEVNEQ